jgi:hypothetical protein
LDTPRRLISFKGCAAFLLAGIILLIALGPSPLRGETNAAALRRLTWSKHEIQRAFVQDQLDRAGITSLDAEVLLRSNPDCCRMEPVSYNPANWMAWHIIAGWKGSPAWLMGFNFGLEQEGRFYGMRSFGRLTRGGGYLSESTTPHMLLLAVREPGTCRATRLPSGQFLILGAKSDCLGAHPRRPHPAVRLLVQTERDALLRAIRDAREECHTFARGTASVNGCSSAVLVIESTLPGR